MRDIASEAGEPVSLIHHHGQGKEVLFHQTVARRADTLAEARRTALEVSKADGPLTVEAVLAAFFGPYLDLAAEQPEWLAYARLIAHVSADPRWRDLAAELFDPTAQVFVAELAVLLPDTPPERIASGFVFGVSSMLALVTSDWRVAALGGAVTDRAKARDRLVAYTAAGLRAL